MTFPIQLSRIIHRTAPVDSSHCLGKINLAEQYLRHGLPSPYDFRLRPFVSRLMSLRRLHYYKRWQGLRKIGPAVM